MRKGAVMVKVKALSWHLPAGIEKHHENSHLGLLMVVPIEIHMNSLVFILRL